MFSPLARRGLLRLVVPVTRLRMIIIDSHEPSDLTASLADATLDTVAIDSL